MYDKSQFDFMSQITEDDDVKDVNDPEYNRLLDNVAKKQRSNKEEIIEAARRLEDIG